MTKFKSRVLMFIVGLIIAIYYLFIHSPALKENIKQTTGRIIDFDKDYKHYAYNIIYEFNVNGTTITNQSIIKISGNYIKYFKSKTFPVIYNINDNNINYMLITPSDFDEYEIPYPDSLNWVRDKLVW